MLINKLAILYHEYRTGIIVKNNDSDYAILCFLYYTIVEVIIMELRFDNILSKLSAYKIDIFLNQHSDISYKEVKFIYSHEMNLDKNIIYIGKVSMLPDKMYTYKDIGLILIKDDTFDASLFHVNIAVLPAETNVFKLFDDVQNIFSLNRKLIDSSAVLLNSLIKGKGLKYIVQVGSEILGNPVFLIDASSKLLASSTNTNVHDSIWDELISLGYGSHKYFSPYISEGFVEKITANPLPIIIDSVFIKNLRRIVGKILIKDKIIGYICILENNQKFKEEDINIAGLLCDVISSEMKKNKLYENRTGVMHEYLIVDLLDERIGNYKMAEERSESLFSEPYRNFLVAVVSMPENNINAHLVEHLRWSFESLLPSCKSVYHNEQIIILLNTENHQQLQNIKIKLINILKENNLIAGLSLIFHNIMEIKKYYIQSENALRLGKFLKRKNYLFEYDDLYIYDLLTLMAKDLNLKDFCHPSINKIVEHDKLNGTDYYHTLYEYLLNSGNVTLTAKKLFIHRNTMVHRITKISEISGMDLNNGNNRFKLFLTYKIMELSI
ncbi:PucR family transcriptional regulator [Irregularibacter muris]|nr:PucR family transcriptional regulator [Irregularibacter muris]